MKPYTYQHHTADAQFRAYGKNIEEAFSNAALATYNIMVKTKKVKPKMSRKINLKAKELRNLLYDFIQEMIILLDTDGFVLNKIKSIRITEGKDFKLIAELLGDHYSHYDVHTPIKSMTYSDMKIEKKKGIYMLQVVVDI